jgi:uncharacterized protein YbcC (UPF0753/DUF2309 family)
MEVITIQSEAFQELINSIQEIKSKIDTKHKEQPLPETWLDISDTCKLLHISKRTLQNYRDQGIISFSQIAGKIYFRATDIQAHLERHYIKSFSK